MVKLGSAVRDTLTGFKGMATGRTEYLYGCARILVEPSKLDKDDKVIECMWFDEQRIEVIKETGPTVSKDSSSGPGGPHDTPTRVADPIR